MTIAKRCHAYLTNTDSPKYRAITEALAREISAGALAPGTRLPPQRELANALGVTLGTVTRAYTELRRRGQLSADVGRGSFVAKPRARPAGHFPEYDAAGVIHLDANHPCPCEADAWLAQSLQALGSVNSTSTLWDYPPRGGLADHKRAGAAWLAKSGYQVEAEQLVVTVGAQQAILLALAALAQPDDAVAVAELTYPGLIAAARLLRLELVPLALGDRGVDPEAFRTVCRKRNPKALYCVPTLHNPTGETMPLARRRELAATAREFGVSVIEDDVYSNLVQDPPPPLTKWCPELGWSLSSLSKTVAPGLRVGYLHVPAAHIENVGALLMSMTLATSPICAHLAMHAINQGFAETAVAAQRAELEQRWELAGELIPVLKETRGGASAPHAWLRLPGPWRAREFVDAARARGVAVAPAELFAVGRSHAPQAVRISLGATSRAELTRGLGVLRELLRELPGPTAVAV